MTKKFVMPKRSDSHCFVVAEVGQNHQGDVETAMKLFDALAYAGFDAVKLQKRDNKTLYTKKMYNKPYDSENSFGATYGEHREALEFDKTEYMELKKYAESKNLVFFATAFDIPSVEFLEDVDVPTYKIASGDVTNLPLLARVAETGKPVFLSTGASCMSEVRQAYEVLRKGAEEICIMQCTSVYPSEAKDTHLSVISTYLKEFPDCTIGFSSHDNGIMLPVGAYMLGARAIEKHCTLSRTMKGADHNFSLELPGQQKLIRDLRRIEKAIGDPEKICYSIEMPAKEKLGKSLFFAKDLQKGHVIVSDDLVVKSPGNGTPPSMMSRIVGMTLASDVVEEMMVFVIDYDARFVVGE